MRVFITMSSSHYALQTLINFARVVLERTILSDEWLPRGLIEALDV